MQPLKTNQIVNLHMNSLKPDTVHIWTITLNCPPEKQIYYKNLLSSDEIYRANRFTTTMLKNRFTVGRGKLRKILASYTVGIAPENLLFNTNQFGKPYLCDFDSICFNFTHSEDIAMLAVANNREVGIDLEKHTNIDINAVANRIFSEHEMAKLQILPDETRIQFFLKIWVRKEAYVKALGKGLSYPIKDFSVSTDFFDEDALISDQHLSTSKGWKITDISCPANYYAALCGAEKDWQYLFMSDSTLR